MKKSIHYFFKVVLVFFFCLFVQQKSYSQTYTMAAGTINTCSGTFYDPGSTSNYGNNLNVTQTFCSNAGNCLRITFTNFSTQSGNDILTIYDGPSTASSVIGVFSGNTSPGTITSSSGCLTFKFVTNASTTKSGWVANFSCVACGTSILMNNNTAVSTCSALFYDSGGPAGNYSNNQNFTKTFCSNAGSCLKISFTSIDLRNSDVLTLYDGNAVSSPLIGAYTGTTLPPTILASSGCITVNFYSNSTSNSAGWEAIVSCENCPSPPAGSATYTQPTTGLQNTYVGTNMVSTCGGTFTDNGGVGGNYSNSINRVYRTFCPNTAGKCLRANFWSLDLQGPAGAFLTDYLIVLNGPTQNSPQFGASSTWYGTASTYQACMAAGLGPYTSTDQSGCLTFVFNSDATTNRAGWVATLDCITCPNGPNGTDNSDCKSPTAICSNQSFTDASTGPGIVSDGGGGCVLSENFSNWYKILISTSGNLGLTIAPNVTADDYDFALYSSSTCAGLGSPVRCSYAANTGSTGLNNALNLSTNTAVCGTPNNGSDVSEDVCGNAWVNELAVIAGQTYYLLVNKWTPGGSGFTLNWLLTAGASLNCTVLPVELINFEGKVNGENVVLNWSTASETNNNYFKVERSVDGRNFETIQIVGGAGNSSIQNDYVSVDDAPLPGISYYRLKQVDYDGTISYSSTIAIEISAANVFYLVPNPAKDKVKIVYGAKQKEDFSLKIYNMQGINIYSEVLHSDRGINQQDILLDDLEKGIYFIVLENQFSIYKSKLIKF